MAGALQVVEQELDALPHLFHQLLVGRRLLGVRVETVDGDVEQTGSEPALNELRDQLELLQQRLSLEAAVELHVLQNLLELLHGGIRLQLALLHELQHARAVMRARGLRQVGEQLFADLDVFFLVAAEPNLERLVLVEAGDAGRGPAEGQRQLLGTDLHAGDAAGLRL